MTASKSARGSVRYGYALLNECIEIVLFPSLGGGSGDDLLRQNVERVLRNLQLFQLAFVDG